MGGSSGGFSFKLQRTIAQANRWESSFELDISEPGTRSMWCCMSLMGGSSSGITSGNFSRSGWKIKGGRLLGFEALKKVDLRASGQ